MRKTLLASAALIVMGGGAYAEVSVTGSGNFGVKFDGAKSGSDALTFHHEFDIAFTASGTTDGGLTFGGSVGIDDQESTSGTADLAGTYDGGYMIIESKKANPGDRAADKCYVSTHQKYATVYTKTGSDANAVYKKGDELIFTFGELVGHLNSRSITDPARELIGFIDESGAVDPTATKDTKDRVRLTSFTGCTDIVRDIKGANPVGTSGTIANNASVHIGFDVHTLTIGDGLDAGDVAAGVDKTGGVADVGFDGIGVDDVAESLRGKTSVDVVYTGSFGLANVRVSSGGDDNWGVGFNFNVAPVTIGVGFDSKKVASIGLGLTQGPVSGRLLYSTESENDKKAYGAEIGYTISEGTSVTIVYSQSKDPAGSDMDAVGFGFSHGLGGGATLAAGIGQVNDETKADLGITMAF